MSSTRDLGRRVARLVAAAGVLLAVATTVPASAQAALQLSTAYPGVLVEAGSSATFPLQVSVGRPQRVRLQVTEIPQGWTAVLRGGGFIVTDVFAGGEEPPQLDMEVQVPPDAQRGRHDVVVTATAGGFEARLPLSLRIADEVAGGVTLAAEFPQLQGAADLTFTFDLTLDNSTPRELRFALEAAGPEGWVVTARPSGETQAATATVAAGSSTAITVEADPPDDAAAGPYPIQVSARAGNQQATAELEAEVTGSFAMTLTTPDERLNAAVTAGGTTPVTLLVVNDGASPLVDVELTSTPPGDWEVTFEPERVDQIPPGEAAEVVARLTPSADAVAGDYLVNVSASAGEANADMELRTTVETSALWGLIGVLLIILALAGLGWVFRRYGRR